MDGAYQRAWAAFQMGRYDACRQCVLDGLRDDPRDLDLICLLGHVQLIAARYSQARDLGRNAIEIDPEDARGYYTLAWGTLSDVHYQPSDGESQPQASGSGAAVNARVEVARRLAHRCLEIDPQSASYFALLAEIELLAGDPQAALRASDNGLQADPLHRSCAEVRIRALRELRRLEEAIQTGLSRLSVQPEDARCHQHLAQLYLEQKEIDSSLRHARQAVRLEPTETEHRQTYWDAVKAKNPLFRPLVHWQFIARRLAASSQGVQTAAFILIPTLAGGLAALAQWLFGYEGAPFLVVLAIVLVAFLLAAERPCMTLVDLVMFASDHEYRSAVDRKDLAIGTAATLGVTLTIACCVVSGLLDTYTPLFALLSLAIFCGPLVCLIHSDSLAIKLSFVASLLVMAVCLTACVMIYQDAQDSSDRIRAIYAFIAFLFTGFIGPVLYLHYHRR